MFCPADGNSMTCTKDIPDERLWHCSCGMTWLEVESIQCLQDITDQVQEELLEDKDNSPSPVPQPDIPIDDIFSFASTMVRASVQTRDPAPVPTAKQLSFI